MVSCAPAGREHPMQGGPEAAGPALETAAGRTGGQEPNLTASLGRQGQPSAELLKKLPGPRSAAPCPKDIPILPSEL